MQMGDIDFHEVNEAFSAVALARVRGLAPEYLEHSEALRGMFHMIWVAGGSGRGADVSVDMGT